MLISLFVVMGYGFRTDSADHNEVRFIGPADQRGDAHGSPVSSTQMLTMNDEKRKPSKTGLALNGRKHRPVKYGVAWSAFRT
jgi:hypothetical protein